MKKLLLLCFTCVWGCLQLSYAQSSSLKFNSNGKFKIVQFTDLHYIYDNPESDIALERVNEVVDAEKPDLIIVTGDVIYGKPADKSMRAVLDVLAKKKTPFVILFGNHDDEFGLSRSQLFDIIKSYPYNATTTVEGLSGIGNCIFSLKGTNGKDEAILYCLDSHAYSSIEGIDGYDYIKPDQIQWYRSQSAAFAKQNGSKPIPSLAFFHIPFPEYTQAASDEESVLIGTRGEKVCPPALNSGLFTAMKEMGDIMGVFVGHDHDNDYAVYYKDILLSYGRYTGGNTVYNHLKPNGARVIELTEGERSFKTWIHLKGNKIIHTINYPSDLVKSKD
ncbi:3' 5'-cyclic adenosine monophosphate phosphodiesterase CpdA [termite gut metagenome]|uniref:3' 5'-cyclic adenosine monophosphate phosphodiesterase CpdA n=1 Tax=termite gut metagenome TaxID=433724 RepID=A0A5J4QWR4_9ZZZZ